jgi:hypothetical protein
MRLLIDHNFDQNILRGLLRLVPDLDFVTVFEIGMSRTPDPELLIWAANEQRLMLTHDRRTMPAHAKDVIEAGHDIAGVIIVSDDLPMALVIEQLELIIKCTAIDEWQNVVRHLPLR